eukprot:1155215-Pelagomonas_calceolata.AAC.6
MLQHLYSHEWRPFDVASKEAGSLIGCSLQTVHWLPVQGLLCAKQQGHARSSTRLPSAVPHVTSSGLAATAWSHRVRPTSPEEVPIPLCQRLPAYEAPANAGGAWFHASPAVSCS